MIKKELFKLKMILLMLILPILLFSFFVFIYAEPAEESTEVLIARTIDLEAKKNLIDDSENILNDVIVLGNSKSSFSGGGGGGSGGGNSNFKNGYDKPKGDPVSECLDAGFDFFAAKWECDASSWTETDETAYEGTSVIGTCASADWDVGNSGADGIVVKAATIREAMLGESGTVIQLNSHDISHITFCGYEEEPYCGDGILDEGEECDDGNLIGGDGCSSECEIEEGECYKDSDCDEDEWSDEEYCVCTSDVWDRWITYECVNPGTAESYCDSSTERKLREECGEDYCEEWEDYYCIGKEVWKNRTCYDLGCSQGECFNESYEEEKFVEECLYDCVDGSCTETVCGNGIKEGNEECDDGNDNNFDECRNDCTLPCCGDDIIDEGEECEIDLDCNDSNESTTDTCSQCVCEYEEVSYCGDGILDEGEECDLGGDNGILCEPPYDGSCAYCSDICEEVTLYDGYCGDGVIQEPYEECEFNIDCDDSNESTTDTCSQCVCEYEGIGCNEDDDCGEDGWIEDLFCVGTANVWDWWIIYECVNPGTAESYCDNSTEQKLREECGEDYCEEWENTCYDDDVYRERTCYDKGCEKGACFNNEHVNREKIEECYPDYCESYWDDYYCKDNEVWKNRTCYYGGCEDAECYAEPYEEEVFVEECEICVNGRCEDVECYEDSDCEEDGWLGIEFCWCGKLFDYYIDNFCVEGGTAESYCDSSTTLMIKGDCENQFLALIGENC